MAGRAGYSGFVARQPGYMLLTKYKRISYSNFNTAVFIRTAWFESYLVKDLEAGFSRDVARFVWAR